MTGGSSAERVIAADRRELPVAMVVVLASTTACSVGSAAYLLPTQSGDPVVALGGGMLAGALAVVALRSISIRSATRWMCIVGALLILRFGDLSNGRANGPLLALVWVLATSAALVAAGRAERWLHRIPASTVPSGGGASSRRHAARLGRLGRVALVIGALAAAAGTGIGPMISDSFVGGPRSGLGPRGFGNGGALSATDTLDMTSRPRLGDALVMTVASDAPGFWRNQTFDTWDGSSWTRSDPSIIAVPASGQVVAPEDFLPSDDRTTIREDFRIEASFANALPLSPTAETVTTPSNVAQWNDGSVVSSRGLGRGASYQVVSRRNIGLTEADLRATSSTEIPDEVRRRFATEPVASRQVQALAADLAAGAPTAIDKVRAIDAWLADNTTYSIDAPLSPAGVDVVDHFLFTSKNGWCEQIASSMVVLLRLQGVPARLATGFVPEGRDPVTGRYQVLERGAHAWAEVWFPEVGWVPFDPTADVPVSGVAELGGVMAAISEYAPTALLVLGLVLGVGGAVFDVLRRLPRRLTARVGRRRRAGRPADWPGALDARLDGLGHGWGRPRAPAETSTAYARELGARLDDERLVAVGRTADRARYGVDPPDEAERAAAAAVLDALEAAPPP